LVLIGLLAFAAPQLRVPDPILLVVGGVILALLHGVPVNRLDPELVFNATLSNNPTKQ